MVRPCPKPQVLDFVDSKHSSQKTGPGRIEFYVFSRKTCPGQPQLPLGTGQFGEGRGVAQDIDRKLRVTAAFLGAVTAKDLAAAFRRANPVTSFDVERAHKWIQGRARPRESRLYEDWAKVVDLDRPGAWIADCISTTSSKSSAPGTIATGTCWSGGSNRRGVRLRGSGRSGTRRSQGLTPATRMPGRPIFAVRSSGENSRSRSSKVRSDFSRAIRSACRPADCILRARRRSASGPNAVLRVQKRAMPRVLRTYT
jgi:hypothetical protein